MADAVIEVHNSCADMDARTKRFTAGVGLSQMLLGGAIIEVTNSEQAKIAEEGGACCIVVHQGIIRMPDPSLVREIKQAVSIPVMARVRIGHFVEAQILEAVGVDYIDESELLNDFVDDYINKHKFQVPFACGCGNLEEALLRVTEGAVIIWIGGVSHWNSRRACHIGATVQTVRSVMKQLREFIGEEDEGFAASAEMLAPYDLVAQIKQMGRLPAAQFAAGGIVTPADAALMMQLGCDGVFVGAEIFNRPDPYKKIQGIVLAVRHYDDPRMLAESSWGLKDDGEEDSDDFM